MKVRILIFSLILVSVRSSAQTPGEIMSTEVFPAEIAEGVEAFAVMTVYLNNMASFDSSSVTAAGPTFFFDLYHCMGPLTAIDIHPDTVSLGNLSAGSYTVIFTSWLGGGGFGPCSGFSSLNSDTLLFDVADSSGASLPEHARLKIFPNPASQFVQIANPSAEILELTSLGGSFIMLLENENGRFYLPVEIASGFYQAIARTASGEIIGQGKISVIR